MLQYDGDLNIPEHYLVQPPVIKNTLTEVLCAGGVLEYALSETHKFGHVTYFWNGNRSGKVCEELEVYEEVPSDVIPIEQAPAMKSKEITEKMVANMASKKFQFLRCNYPNGDMVEEVPSDVIPIEQAPAMKSKEITEKMVANMASKKFQFLRCNYPNGDMVGHTGVMDAVL